MELKKPHLKRKEKESEPSVSVNFAVGDFNVGGYEVPAYAAADTASDAFAVDVRNADASVKMIDEDGTRWWNKVFAPGLSSEIGTAFALMSLFALLLASASLPTAIPFALAGVVTYLVLTYLGNIMTERVKYYAAAGTILVLVVVFIVLRHYIWGGIGTVMNEVYGVSESEQAYIYNKFNVSSDAESHPDMSVRLAVIWVSMLVGAIASIPPAIARKVIGVFAVCASMIAYAYYGIMPSVVCLVVMAVALILLLAGGSLLSTLPVLLATLLIFGVILLISPGENYGISRADENIRDRLALRSAYLETNLDMEMPDQSEMFDNVEKPDDINNDSVVQNKGMLWLIIGGLVLLALAGAVFFIYSRYKKRREKNRLGLDNPDPKKAITAMFPYGVKWLGAGDMDVSGKAFEKLIPVVEHDISPEYAENFEGMYALWQEAAYSDHPMDEEGRASMQSFLDDTISAITGNFNFKDKILTALKYAL
jgi:hypothetical protein